MVRNIDWNKVKPNLLAGLLIALIVVLLFYKLLFSSLIISKGLGDNLTGNFPYQVFLANIREAGFPAGWSSYIYLGFPIIAEAVAGNFNFFLKLFFLIFPANTALNLVIIASYVLAAVGAYVLALKIGVSRLSSIVVAVSWISSTYMLGLSDSAVVLTSALWTPWILWGFLRLSEKTDLDRAAFLSLFIGMQLLTTYIQFSVITVLAGLVLYFFRMRVLGHKIDVRGISILAGILALALGLAAIQILPTAEFTLESPRLKSNMALAVNSSLTPWGSLVSVALPHLTIGMPAKIGGSSFYIGIVALCLALYAFIKVRTRELLIYKILFMAFFLLALGKYTPLYFATSALPVFSIFRFPEHYLLMATLALSICAGAGLDGVSKIVEPEQARKTIRLLLYFFSVLLTGTILISLLLNYGLPFIRDYAQDYVKNKYVGSTGHPFLIDEYFQRIEIILTLFAARLSLLNLITAGTFVLILGFIITGFAFFKEKLTRINFLTVVLVLVIGNAALTAWGMHTLKFVDYQELTGAPVPEYLKNTQREKYRIYSWPHANKVQLLQTHEALTGDTSKGAKYAAAMLPVQVNMLYGIESISGLTSLWDHRIKNILDRIEGNNTALNEDQKLKRLPGFLSLLGLLNVKYVLSQSLLKHPDLIKEKTISGTHIYRNQKALKRAFIVDQYDIADPAATFNKLFDKSFEPAERVLLERKPDLKVINKSGNPGRARIVDYRSNRIVIETRSDRNGLLVLSDAYYPGWKATMDGEAVPIMRANYVLKAIAVERGRHRTVIRYNNTYLFTGGIVSAVSLGLLLILYILGAAGARSALLPRKSFNNKTNNKARDTSEI